MRSGSVQSSGSSREHTIYCSKGSGGTMPVSLLSWRTLYREWRVEQQIEGEPMEAEAACKLPLTAR